MAILILGLMHSWPALLELDPFRVLILLELDPFQSLFLLGLLAFDKSLISFIWLFSGLILLGF